MRSPMKRGFTLIELLVVIAIIAILASILFPVFAKARSKARQAQCNSNVRQLALAVQMYAQDNGGQYPGTDGSSWVSKVAPYLGNSGQMFACPEDTTKDSGAVSYALAGILIRQDQTGVKEANVNSPSEVGVIADASPSETYPNGRLIGGGGQVDIAVNGATIEPRHSKGAIVGYADGHAKYFQGAVNLNDEGNGAVRALYHAVPLGLIDNPMAGLGTGTAITGIAGTFTVGGEYATYPFLMAAARMYGTFYTAGFKGEYYTTGRPATYVWGTAGTTNPSTSSAVAYDGVCVIVAKGCKIPGFPSMANGTYAVATSTVRTLFETGFVANTVQVYHMSDTYCSTNAYIKGKILNANWGTDSVEVANDAEMVEKVSNDPYGIGYCSTAFADPDRVVILPVGTALWPSNSTKFRWVMPTYSASSWPWKRALDVTADTNGLALANKIRTSTFKTGLNGGPLFSWGYWVGAY